MLMVFDEMAFPICDQGYLTVRKAAVLWSLLVHGTLCSLSSDDLSLSLHLALCPFQFYIFCCNVSKCSVNRKF